ncbi:MAG: hypothetical protein ACNA7W_02255 [Pseudomonadales bacterium]
MKLTSWSDLVKPDRDVLKIAFVSVLIAAFTLHLVGRFSDREQQRLDGFGSATAAALAELVAEPLMRQDRMHLGVIGNRLADLPHITGVASYTPDNQLLATTGDLLGPEYARAVSVDGSIIGYVSVSLARDAFAEHTTSRTVATLLAMLLLPFAVAMGWSLAQPGRRQALLALLPTLQWPSQTSTAPPQPPAEDPAPAATEMVHYLLAVNLYNQLSLGRNEREFELSLCLELAEDVAARYQGQVVGVPGLGALLSFDHTDDPDRPFQILCAAFVLARLLRDETPFGTYRLGLNLTIRPADQPLPLEDPAIADAALLSALAKDACLALSEPFAAALEGRQRLAMKPLANPLLDELATSGTDCYLVTELAAPFATQVLEQAEELRCQREAISSPSTF